MGVWDTPPSAAEAGNAWAAPPTQAEVHAARGALADPGKALSFARGATQGAQLGFGDEIEGGIQALGRKFLPDSLGGGSEADRRKSFGDLYRDSRNVSRKENAAAQEHHPVLYGAGEVTGGIAPAIVAGAAFAPAGPAWAVSRGAKVAGAVKTAATLGGGAALGASEGGPGQMAMDTAKGAAIGVGLLPVAGAAEAVLGPAARALRNTAVTQGRKVLSGGKQTLSRSLRPVGEEAVQEALDTSIVPFGTTKGTAQRLATEQADVGQQYAQIIAMLEAKGIRGPQAHQLAQGLAQEAQAIEANTLGSPRPGMFRDTARELYRKPVDPAGRLGLGQTEGMKQELQWKARAAYDRQNHLQTPEGDAQEQIASRVRQAVEDAVDAQRGAAPEAAAAFVPVKQQYGRLTEALNAAREGAASQARRSGPNLTDTIHMAASPTLSGKLLSKVLSKTWRERGPSTLAYGADSGANFLDWLAQSGSGPQTKAQMLAELLRRGAARSLSDKYAEGQ